MLTRARWGFPKPTTMLANGVTMFAREVELHHQVQRPLLRHNRHQRKRSNRYQKSAEPVEIATFSCCPNVRVL